MTRSCMKKKKKKTPVKPQQNKMWWKCRFLFVSCIIWGTLKSPHWSDVVFHRVFVSSMKQKLLTCTLSPHGFMYIMIYSLSVSIFCFQMGSLCKVSIVLCLVILCFQATLANQLLCVKPLCSFHCWHRALFDYSVVMSQIPTENS